MIGKSTEARISDAVKDASISFQAVSYLLIASLLAISGARTIGWPSSSWLEVVDRIVLYLGFIILLFAFLLHELRTIRKRRFAKIQPHLHMIMHKLRDIHCYLDELEPNSQGKYPQPDPRILSTNLKDVLSYFASSFSMLTGTNCRACIKLITFGEGNESNVPFVVTLARDGASTAAAGRNDDQRWLTDKIDENTDFREIFRDGERYFFSNDLTELQGYLNSSDANLSKRRVTRRDHIFSLLGKSPANWRLNYRSTIVWPIRVSYDTLTDEDDFGLVGFLAIDSPSRDVFDQVSDFEFGAAVADTLFPILRRLQTIAESENEDYEFDTGS